MHPMMDHSYGYWPAYASGVWLFLLLFWLVVIGIPLIRILTKAGYSGVWVILGIVPVVNLIALWVFAFSRWPSLNRSA